MDGEASLPIGATRPCGRSERGRPVISVTLSRMLSILGSATRMTFSPWANGMSEAVGGHETVVAVWLGGLAQAGSTGGGGAGSGGGGVGVSAAW